MTNQPIELNLQQKKNIIELILAALLNPDVAAETLLNYITPDYQQWVNGITLDRQAFLQHARQLKSILHSGQAVIHRFTGNGDSAVSIHDVAATKNSGEQINIRVIAWFTFQAEKICAVEEMSSVALGTEQDHQLASCH
ncbi:nuclear transport factor 2 family protein [Affinibrenneria salicis]|nr:nuclear transport factor 2 family protein [Affinibrenneria salicis]